MVDLKKISTAVLEAIVKAQLAAARELRQMEGPASSKAALSEVIASLADHYLQERRKGHGGLVLEEEVPPEREHRTYGDVTGSEPELDAG